MPTKKYLRTKSRKREDPRRSLPEKSLFDQPVFLFLDANVSLTEEEVIRWRLKIEGVRFFLVPFSESLVRRRDSEVILMMQKEILRLEGPSHGQLKEKPSPIFLFLTRDLDFVADAAKELKANKFLGWTEGIILGRNCIHLAGDKAGERQIDVIYIKVTEFDHRPEIVEKMFKTTIDFLSQLHP